MPHRSPSRVLRVLALALAPAVVAGCGGGSAPGSPAAGRLPLAPGTRIVASVRRCDGGAHPFCGRELVVAARGRRYGDPGGLKIAERTALSRAGWAQAQGALTDELAADSPGDRLRVTYATAEDDLLSVDAHQIMRAPRILRALSATLLAHRAALSLLLEAGSG